MKKLYLLIAWLILGAGTSLYAQDSLWITFRYIPDPEAPLPERAFLPGDFNDWGPNQNGYIAPGAPSQMEWVRTGRYWRYRIRLDVGGTHWYKIHLHYNADGTQYAWINDPLNPLIEEESGFRNNVLVVQDPMIFQPATEPEPYDADLVGAVSAGIFSSTAIDSIYFEVNGVPYPGNGVAFYDTTYSIFRYKLDRSVKQGAQFKLVAVTAAGDTVQTEIGQVLPPITWRMPPFATVHDSTTLRATITRLDGTVDPNLTQARLIRVTDTDSTSWMVPVSEGQVAVRVPLAYGENHFYLQAEVDGRTFLSEPLTVRRKRPWPHFVSAYASGSSFAFTLSLSKTAEAPETFQRIAWEFDEQASTVAVSNLQMEGLQASGQASGPGEIYLNFSAVAPDGREHYQRFAIIVEESGNARLMRYEENPSWVKSGVIYEIFPLSFGPRASGTKAQPGRRLQEIREHLPYLKDMGFTILWLMPVMDNHSMTEVSGGYNIVDFYTVDENYGTNEDLRDLVATAHSLGMKVILDITPNHVSPHHPWVESVRKDYTESVYWSYLQHEINPHNRGEDGRGANLPEIWHEENGRKLYRKYEGFGDLANVYWDEADLQRAFLEIFEYWVRNYDIDGWRLDVFWGPRRRYGKERFDRPLRDLMKRIKPDALLLGEVAGTGFNTEVYYADAVRGKRVVGGLDAAYDWNFYFNGIRGGYASISTYDALAHNGDFWPGPHARYLRFLENHDEERIAKVFESTLDRVLPLTGYLLTTTGLPMVYQGQEVGFGAGMDAWSARRGPVDWNTPVNHSFATYYQRLVQARRQLPAFWTQDLRTLHAAGKVYGYVRPYPDENAVVYINFSSNPLTVVVDATDALELTASTPAYTDPFTGWTFTDPDTFQLTLEPYETRILVAHPEGRDVHVTLPPLPALPFGATYVGTEDDGLLPTTPTLEGNYPNPFHTTTRVRFYLPGLAEVNFEVFDLLGRRIYGQALRKMVSGWHEVVVEAADWPGGVYLYRLIVNGQSFTGKMVHLP